MLSYFGDEMEEPCGNCDTCLYPVETWDATLAAKKAIYLVKQTGQRFGAVHLTNIMLGKANERMTKFGHDRLSAFGRGTELSEREWASVFRQLVAMGFLSVDMEHYGSIKLTSESPKVLQGDVPISLRKDHIGSEKKKSSAKSRRTGKSMDPETAAVFEALRVRRMELSKKLGVPPYVIFHDSTLQAMAEVRPSDLEEMSRISGVGEHKLAKYGQIFLDAMETPPQNAETPILNAE
jgi:ATP-dependent DNA helicase RecQ